MNGENKRNSSGNDFDDYDDDKGDNDLATPSHNLQTNKLLLESILR